LRLHNAVPYRWVDTQQLIKAFRILDEWEDDDRVVTTIFGVCQWEAPRGDRQSRRDLPQVEKSLRMTPDAQTAS
jgi:hypothetical protein